MIDVRQLRYFAAIVDMGSFTKAAGHLGIAQPSLGYQVRKLEDELGVQLLMRNSRGVHLTEPGRVLYERGARILADLDDLSRDVSSLAGGPRGAVSLGITPSLADRLLIPLVRRIRADLPEVELSVTEDMSQNLVAHLEEGRVDMALAFDVPPTRGLLIQRLGEDSVFLLYKSSEPSPDQSPAKLSEMAGYPLILPHRPHRIRRIVEDAARQHGLELNVVAEMHSLASIIRMVENGLGATLVAGSMSRRRLSEGRLVTRAVVEPALVYDIALVQLDSRPLSRGQSMVAAICAKMVSQLFDR